MTNETKSGVFLGCGFLLILLGSMPLNLVVFLWLAEVYHDPSTGSIPHLHLILLIGLILWSMGIVSITLGTKKAWLVPMMGLGGIGGGILINLPSFSYAGDYKGALGFLASSAIGITLAAATRMALNVYAKTVHRTA
jgi:hypothetical protein